MKDTGFKLIGREKNNEYEKQKKAWLSADDRIILYHSNLYLRHTL